MSRKHGKLGDVNPAPEAVSAAYRDAELLQRIAERKQACAMEIGAILNKYGLRIVVNNQIDFAPEMPVAPPPRPKAEGGTE